MVLRVVLLHERLAMRRCKNYLKTLYINQPEDTIYFLLCLFNHWGKKFSCLKIKNHSLNNLYCFVGAFTSSHCESLVYTILVGVIRCNKICLLKFQLRFFCLIFLSTQE